MDNDDLLRGLLDFTGFPIQDLVTTEESIISDIGQMKVGGVEPCLEDLGVGRNRSSPPILFANLHIKGFIAGSDFDGIRDVSVPHAIATVLTRREICSPDALLVNEVRVGVVMLDCALCSNAHREEDLMDEC